jgi:hypothetical protein
VTVRRSRLVVIDEGANLEQEHFGCCKHWGSIALPSLWGTTAGSQRWDAVARPRKGVASVLWIRFHEGHRPLRSAATRVSPGGQRAPSLGGSPRAPRGGGVGVFPRCRGGAVVCLPDLLHQREGRKGNGHAG